MLYWFRLPCSLISVLSVHVRPRLSGGCLFTVGCLWAWSKEQSRSRDRCRRLWRLDHRLVCAPRLGDGEGVRDAAVGRQHKVEGHRGGRGEVEARVAELQRWWGWREGSTQEGHDEYGAAGSMLLWERLERRAMRRPAERRQVASHCRERCDSKGGMSSEPPCCSPARRAWRPTRAPAARRRA